VPEIELTARSGLEHLKLEPSLSLSAPQSGTLISLHENAAIASVLVRKGRQQALSRAVRDAFGVDLPPITRRNEHGGTAFVWTGPGQWLATRKDAEPHTFQRELEQQLGPFAAICDQSDGRTLIRLSGLGAREVLAKGPIIDLHPRVFGPGDVAATALAHIPVVLCQLDETPTYELSVFRSFAPDLCRWLLNAGAAFG
jgi:methylglutamate dehydrogenase subunit D